MNKEYWEKAFKEIEEMSDEEFIKLIEMYYYTPDVFMIMKEEVKDEN